MDRARQPDQFAPKTATSRRGKRAKAPARQVPNITLSVVLTGEEPPTEFRLFTAGTVETTKGTFVFDEASAKSVMAEYAAHAIDLMIDYDHASLAGVSLDPATAGKAAGWFNLEVRTGELWAVNVRWTEPAAEALRAKEWRFMSPAFCTEGDRITSVMNVAITNLPATRRLEPLMAASAVTQLGENAMSVEEFLKVCKALGIDMSGSLEDAMAKIKGEPKLDNAAEDAIDGGADDAQEAPIAAAAPPAVPPAEDKPEEVAAALSAVQSLSGKSSLVASVADIRTWHASHVTLATEREAIAKREAVIESAERRKLCTELVTLGGRHPAQVWATPDAGAPPKAYLVAMPIADLRAMHADAVKTSGKTAAIRPPVPAEATAAGKTIETPHGPVTLSAREVANCEAAGAKLDVYAANKAFQIKSRNGSKE